MELLEYFEPIAHTHAALEEALPQWRSERARHESASRVEWTRRAELDREATEKRRAVEAEQEAQFQAIESSGPVAVLNAILNCETAALLSFPERWAKMPEYILDTLPRNLLIETASRLLGEHASRPWRGLGMRITHLVKSRAKSKERQVWLAKLECSPLEERLRIACASNWALTFFPTQWASELVRTVSQMPAPLRNPLLSKLMRIRRRGLWREARQALLRTHESQ